MLRILILALLLCVPAAMAAEECPKDYTCHFAISRWDTPKYDEKTVHFPYANPNAPKGGVLKLAALGGFDSVNPFILKGVSASGVQGYTFDTLLASGEDEAFTEYGLIAKRILLPVGKADHVIFELRPEAKFHDGKPITAEDVVFSFTTLMSKGHPSFRAYYGDVARAEVLAKDRVKFTFKTDTNKELPLILGQMPVFAKHYYTEGGGKVVFDQTTLTPPLGSGPYKVEALDAGKWIRFKRVPDYWGRDLLVNKGKNNFDQIQFDSYRDYTVSIEAFKAGEYDFRQENIAKNWATAYDIPEVKNGQIVKAELPDNSPKGMQAFAYNIRRPQFSDAKVREALGYAFDFEWTNANIFYGSYTRTESFFSDSELASSGLPSVGEVKLLEPFRSTLPKEVFTTEYKAPVSNGAGGIRANLKKAKTLLEQAGWTVQNGKLANQASGEPFHLEILLYSPTFERVVGPFVQNLKRLGIDAAIRIVDTAQYIKRLEQFDFDMTIQSFPQSLSPGNEQYDFWHSAKADVEGGKNIIGIKHKAVDALVEKIVHASNKQELLTACHALDRVLLWEHYVIPQYRLRKERMIYWNRFGKPEIAPYYGTGFEYWWFDPKKSDALKARLKR